MNKQLALLLVSVFVLGLAAAGCGGDDDESSSGGGDDSAAETTFGGAGADTSDASVEQAAESCESTVPQGPEISEEVKSAVLEMCEASAEGDQEAVIEAAKELCDNIEESAGAAENEALSSVCNSAPVAP